MCPYVHSRQLHRMKRKERKTYPLQSVSHIVDSDGLAVRVLKEHNTVPKDSGHVALHSLTHLRVNADGHALDTSTTGEAAKIRLSYGMLAAVHCISLKHLRFAAPGFSSTLLPTTPLDPLLSEQEVIYSGVNLSHQSWGTY